MTRVLQKLLCFRTPDIFITKKEKEKEKERQQTKLDNIHNQKCATRETWEAKEDYSGKVVSPRKTDIVGAKTFETRGELDLNLHVLARQKAATTSDARERERENQNDERIGGRARSKRGGRTRCTKQTHCKTLVRPITIYTPNTSTYYLKHVLYIVSYGIYLSLK